MLSVLCLLKIILLAIINHYMLSIVCNKILFSTDDDNAGTNMNGLLIALPLVCVVIIAVLLTLLTVFITVRCKKYLRKGVTDIIETADQATLNQSSSTNCSDYEVVDREPDNTEVAIDDDISVNTTANVAYITPQSTAVFMTINMAYGCRTTTN